MPPKLALLITTVFIIFAFRSDRKRSTAGLAGLFWPTLWYCVVASRPVGFWLEFFGIPVPGGSGDPTDGSIIDRTFFALLTVIGLRILSSRKFKWGEAFGRNKWLTAFLAFMAISILWSNYPYVSFKRYIKVVGSVVMAMVVLTNDEPRESFFTVLRRCLYIHLPMSIIFTRYFRDLGVSFEWDGRAEFWNGIATSKNTLGQVAMVGVLYFFWEVRRRWKDYKFKNLHVLYLLMALYLLKGSDNAVSMTSIAVCAFALIVFLRLRALRDRHAAARKFVIFIFGCISSFVVFVLIHSVVMFKADSLFGHIITGFGRDITLTDRTLIWSDVYAATSGNPLFGVGFGGFWIGRLANIPWDARLSWVLGQAHSGYVDTYLQIGWIGGFLLAAVLFSTVPKLLRSFEEDYDFACFRITLFLTIILVNVTESVYLRGDHHLWFVFMMVIWAVPYIPTLVDHEEAVAEPYVDIPS